MRRLAPLLGLAALAACAQQPSVVATTRYLPTYTPGEPMIYGAVPLIVEGTPVPGQPRESVDAAVLAAMQDQGAHATHFVLGPVGRSPYAMVVAFDAPTGLDSGLLCGAGAGTAVKPQQPANGRLHVLMALCRGGDRIAGADGSLARPESLDAPSLRQGLGDFTRAVVPASNPERPNSGSGIP